MRKIFLSIFILTFFSITVFQPVRAQSISENPIAGPFQMMLRKCGYYGEQCCVFKDIKAEEVNINNLFTLPDTPTVGLPALFNVGFQALTAPVTTIFNWATNNIFVPLVNKSQGIFRDTLELKPLHCFEGNTSNDQDAASCVCIQESVPALASLCANVKSGGEKNACLSCVNKGDGVWTGLGCLTTDYDSFIKDKVFGIGLGLAGTISLLCIIYSAFMLQTSQANPEKIKKAQELITNCILGLVLIIFSVFILRLIGVTILKIPGFI